MARITFVDDAGVPHVVQADVGQSVMEVARKNGVPGIRADCGGACACATCHVYVEDDWLQRTGMPDELEQDMLEAADNVRASSRLSCQIEVTPELDGLTLQVPAE